MEGWEEWRRGATGAVGGGQYNWGSMAVSDLQEQRRLALAQWRNSGEAFS